MENLNNLSTTQFPETNIYIMRHGERLDNTYENWMKDCVRDGTYVRCDANMPASLPKRNGSIEAYRYDSPLTNVGLFEALLIGESFLLANSSIRYAYVSPALRCIQTCHSVLKGCGLTEKVQMKVEPGLFEWITFYVDTFPEWMTTEELINSGFNIDTEYVPMITRKQLKEMTSETCEQYYQRGYDFVRNALKTASEQGGGDVLIVAHGSTLDCCSRLLTGGKSRTEDDILQIIDQIPYCSVAKIQNRNDKWRLVNSRILNVSHSANKPFNVDILRKFY